MATMPIAPTGSIVNAPTSDEESAIALLTRAFGADPVCRWTWPETRQYQASFPSFVRAFAGQAFALGTAYCLPGSTGAALWLPPDAQPDEEAVIAVFESSVAEEQQESLFTMFELMASYHPMEPHWYLPLIGVDPSQQRKGLGSELMRQALAACDCQGVPAYLESTNPTNLSLYERHGFQMLGTIQVADSPPLFPMLRPAR